MIFLNLLFISFALVDNIDKFDEPEVEPESVDTSTTDNTKNGYHSRMPTILLNSILI